MILVVGTFRLPLEARDAGRDAMARVVAATRAEPGCLAYAYAEDVLEPGLFRVNEAWSNRAALTAHFDADHMVRWRAERDALGLKDRHVVAHRVTNAEML